MSRYVAAHAQPHGPDDDRPTALQIIDHEDLVGKLADKTILLTGASSGIGIETARALHATGAKLILPVRNMEKGLRMRETIRSDEDKDKEGEIMLVEMDLESLDSIREGVEEILKMTDRLNVLVANAGVMATPKGRTKDGFETQFGTNHVAHFLLFQLLKPLLLESSSGGFQSRVICVSSVGHRFSPLRFDDYNFELPSSYDPFQAYGQSKTCNIYMANEIERRYSSRGVHGISLHPGAIRTNITVHVQDAAAALWEDPAIQAIEKSPQQGAATTMYAALSRDFEGKGGVFLSNCAIMGPTRTESPLDTTDDGYTAYAYDAACEGRLWKDSLKMVGLEDDR